MDTQQTVTSKQGIVRIGKPVSAELPKVKDANVNIRDRLNDVLLTEKHNLVSYQVGLNEVINEDLRTIVSANRNNLQEVHTRFFNELFELVEYQADATTTQQITDTLDVFTNYKVQLPIKQ
jgi:hypothetical protein